MRAKSLRMVLMAVVVMMALLVAVVPSFAQSGTAAAMTGTNNWQTLQPGQTVEYRLNFLGSDTGSVTVMANSNPSNAIGFNVYTDQSWLSLASDSNIKPIGRGTVENTSVKGDSSPRYNGDLIWFTNDKYSGLYHIQVTNNSQQAAQYWIDATGAGNGGLSPFTGNTMLASATGTTAQASTTAVGPRTLPVTGDGSNLVVYLGAGLALIAAGWLATRKATQR